MRLQWESIRSALLSLLNTDNPLLSPCMSRCCWLTQLAAGSHNSRLRSGRRRRSCPCLRTRRRVRRVLIALWFNVSVRANCAQVVRNATTLGHQLSDKIYNTSYCWTYVSFQMPCSDFNQWAISSSKPLRWLRLNFFTKAQRCNLFQHGNNYRKDAEKKCKIFFSFFSFQPIYHLTTSHI